MFFTNSPIVSHFKDVQEALHDSELFSSAIDLGLGNVRPMIPQQLDPPAQTRYRRLLDPLFSRKKMAELVPAIRSHAKALIDEFAEKGECEFDASFAIPLPCHGVPEPVRPAALRPADLPRVQGRDHPPPEVHDRSREGGRDPRHHGPAHVRLLRGRDRAAQG
jgi:cytochrome P450